MEMPPPTGLTLTTLAKIATVTKKSGNPNVNTNGINHGPDNGNSNEEDHGNVHPNSWQHLIFSLQTACMLETLGDLIFCNACFVVQLLYLLSGPGLIPHSKHTLHETSAFQVRLNGSFYCCYMLP